MMIPAFGAEKNKSEIRKGLNIELPDLKAAEVCLITTVDSTSNRIDWVMTCLDSKRKPIVKEKRIASEKPPGEDEVTYSDLELTVEMQNRGFRLASTQDGLFFTKR